MLTRTVPAALLLVLTFGCAAQPETDAAGPTAASSGPAAVPSDPAVVPSSGPAAGPSGSVTEPGAGLPSAARPSAPPKGAGEPALGGARTITGTVASGVEPNCLIMNADGGTHLLIFDDPALRAAAAPGRTVTLAGRSDPTMSTTCQQGVPFLVTSATAAS